MSFAFTLNIKNKFIEFKKPAIMGVINRSPESFFNPANTLDVALKQIEVMVKDGANIIDVGGEATSPQVNLAAGPLLDEEINRVVSTVAAIKKHFDILVSVDTSKPQVMQAAVNAGADIINDQRALQLPGALEMAAKLNVPVCLMHFPSERQPGETSPEVLLQQVLADLTGFVKRAQTAGLNRQQLIIDLGFGQGHYGKNCSENFYLLKKLPAFAALDLPILVGWSRKS
ncbi:MAG: dihydropteroate synthase, partial [Gammaproteobacteria bacterium]|nr:dihydropteroate synthase [Gammaproteobacteria bacterium]